MTALPALGRAHPGDRTSATATGCDFLTIYIKEAHPTDEWQMEQREGGRLLPAADARGAAPGDRQRLRRSASTTRCRWPSTRSTTPPTTLYAGWPERLYVVDEKGVIAYKGKTGPFGYDPDEVEAWLAERFKS